MSFKTKGLLKRLANAVSVAATEVAMAPLAPEFNQKCHVLLDKVSDLQLVVSDVQSGGQVKEAALSLIARAQQVAEGQLEAASLDTPLRLVVRMAAAAVESRALPPTESSEKLFERALAESVDVLLQEYRRFTVLLREMAMGEHGKAEYVGVCKSLLQKLKDVDVAESRATDVHVADAFEKLRDEVRGAIVASKEFINGKYQGDQLDKLRGPRDERIERLVKLIKKGALGVDEKRGEPPKEEPTVPVMLLSPRDKERLAAPPSMAQAMLNQYHNGGDDAEEPEQAGKGKSKSKRVNPRRASPRLRKSQDAVDTGEALSPRPKVGDGPITLVSPEKVSVLEAEAKLHSALEEQKKQTLLSPRGLAQALKDKKHKKKAAKASKDDPSQAYRKHLTKEKKAAYNTAVRDARILETLGQYDKAAVTYRQALELTPPGTNPKLESKLRRLASKEVLKEEGIL